MAPTPHRRIFRPAYLGLLLTAGSFWTVIASHITRSENVASFIVGTGMLLTSWPIFMWTMSRGWHSCRRDLTSPSEVDPDPASDDRANGPAPLDGLP